MKYCVLLGAVLTCGLAMPASAYVRCGDNATDFDAVAATRAQVAMQCPCAEATSNAAYRSCTAGVVSVAVASTALPPQCARQVKLCSLRSICGRPAGAVPCCRTNARGVTRCSIRRSAARCTAPRGGTACTSGFTSCCDSCTAGGCIVTPTPTITSTPTQTPTPTIPPFCIPAITAPPGAAKVPVTLAQGSPGCAFPAQPPLSGQVLDDTNMVLASLGLGCLYTGGLPPLTIPDGATTVAEVTGFSGTTLTLGGSAGSGPHDCTKGAGPGKTCLDGAPGIDNQGTCMSDADCATRGACAPTAHCFFGPPIPVPLGPLSVCVVNGFLTDLCGSVDLTTSTSTFAAALSSGVYITNNPTSPCPRCLGNMCDSGPNAGNACTPIGTLQTTPDCPPDLHTFVARLTVVVPQLTTGTSTLTADSNGVFCPGQPDPGGMGLATARVIQETGTGLTPAGIGTFTEALAGTFCIPKTNNALIDSVGRFPAAGALSAAATVDLSQALPLP
jgi:hypothetical protein